MPHYYGSDGDGFNKSTKAYKRNPTIENYVRIRRADPEEEVEVAVIGGMDQLYFMEPELRRFELDPARIASVMDADAESISEVSLQLMEKIIERNQRQKAGETHLVARKASIPDKLVDWIINCALDALSWNDEPSIPRDLIVLIRERLGGSNPEYEKASRTHEMRWSAIIFGAQLMATGQKPSFRSLAKIMRVAPSTVKRWFPKGEFEEEIKTVATWFDKSGELKDDFVLRRNGKRDS
jgi:hypothetical protein